MVRLAKMPTRMARCAVLAIYGLVYGLLIAAPGLARQATTAELVMFDDAGCPWCRRWDREVGDAYPRSEEGKRVPLRRMHISEARRSGLVLVSAVTVTPTFVLVDRGAEVGRITGYPGADFFWAMLDGLIARLPRPPNENGSRDAHLFERGQGSQWTAMQSLLDPSIEVQEGWLQPAG